MVFSSTAFMVFFLPAVIAAYYLLGRKNSVLFIASLFFYAWGEGYYTVLLLASISINYACGLVLHGNRGKRRAKLALLAGVASNLSMLFFFKYYAFFADNVNVVLAYAGLKQIAHRDIHLPIGISFFTFQSITYLVDLYRRQVDVQRNPLSLGLYISLFPQLVAGPIVRYREISESLKRRFTSLTAFMEGVERFVFGFSKKLLIADTLSVPADRIFSMGGQLVSPVAWFGAVCFMLQIYFDFSGYSDMAIGLGKMFGFDFPENFRHPYASRSFREFWRRWHITLSRFFRDYLYIPLGGSRVGVLRTYLNLWTVFLLCGLWHGASWTFVIWGALHGFFLVAERTAFGGFIERSPGPLRRFYLLFFVLIGWVFFRAESLSGATGFLGAMFSAKGWADPLYYLLRVTSWYEVFIAAAGVLFSFPVARGIGSYFTDSAGEASSPGPLLKLGGVAYGIMLCMLFTLSMGTMAAQTHKAFIYFRF